MTTAWKRLGLAALLIVALNPSTFAADTDSAAKPPDLTLIAKQLDVLKKQLDDLAKPEGRLDRLRESIASLDRTVQKDLKEIKDAQTASDLRMVKAQSDVEELRKSL